MQIYIKNKWNRFTLSTILKQSDQSAGIWHLFWDLNSLKIDPGSNADILFV